MMIRFSDSRLFAAVAVAVIAAPLGYVASRAPSYAAPAKCEAPPELTRFQRPLTRISHLINSNQPITIVTVGSSSTAGAGASSPSASYPGRLQTLLRQQLPGRAVTVINRGVNGTEMPEMLARFEQNAITDKPGLVIWQLGTNSLLRDRALTGTPARIAEGLTKFKAVGADVILVNPQYAPRVIAKPEAEHMNQIIASAAKEANVNVFDRFAAMRFWRVTQNRPFSEFLSSDELHMNDWSYNCIAEFLSQGIRESAARAAQTATAPPVAPR